MRGSSWLVGSKVIGSDAEKLDGSEVFAVAFGAVTDPAVWLSSAVLEACFGRGVVDGRQKLLKQVDGFFEVVGVHLARGDVNLAA